MAFADTSCSRLLFSFVRELERYWERGSTIFPLTNLNCAISIVRDCLTRSTGGLNNSQLTNLSLENRMVWQRDIKVSHHWSKKYNCIFGEIFKYNISTLIAALRLVLALWFVLFHQQLFLCCATWHFLAILQKNYNFRSLYF